MPTKKKYNFLEKKLKHRTFFLSPLLLNTSVVLWWCVCCLAARMKSWKEQIFKSVKKGSYFFLFAIHHFACILKNGNALRPLARVFVCIRRSCRRRPYCSVPAAVLVIHRDEKCTLLPVPDVLSRRQSQEVSTAREISFRHSLSLMSSSLCVHSSSES